MASAQAEQAEERKAAEGRGMTQEAGDSVVSKFQHEVKKLAHMSSETTTEPHTHAHTHTTHTHTYFSKVLYSCKVMCVRVHVCILHTHTHTHTHTGQAGTRTQERRKDRGRGGCLRTVVSGGNWQQGRKGEQGVQGKFAGEAVSRAVAQGSQQVF
jgi:hypothetical protein